jgi:hypothetical protein
MDGKALGLVACIQKWFVLFERQRLMVGQHYHIGLSTYSGNGDP